MRLPIRNVPFSFANEIGTYAGNSASAWFDNNGNMLKDESFTGKSQHTFVYDGWNRIVKVEDSTGTNALETFSYDALGRRIVEAPTGSTAKDLYYAANSNVIEERQGSTVTNQYVWGLGYINDLILRDDNSVSGNYGKTGSGLGERLFVQQDANWNITSLADTGGTIKERLIYDPYGAVQAVDPSTWANTTDAYNWLYHFQGGRQDPISGLVHFNTRDYSTTLGRWAEPDRAYIDGPNLYQSMGSNPASAVDPTGMYEINVGGGKFAGPPPGGPGVATPFVAGGTGSSGPIGSGWIGWLSSGQRGGGGSGSGGGGRSGGTGGGSSSGPGPNYNPGMNCYHSQRWELRITGGSRMVWSAVASILSAPFVVTGWGLAAEGYFADNGVAGARQMWSGQPTQTLGSMVIQGLTGADPGDAESLYNTVAAGASMANGAVFSEAAASTPQDYGVPAFPADAMADQLAAENSIASLTQRAANASYLTQDELADYAYISKCRNYWPTHALERKNWLVQRWVDRGFSPRDAIWLANRGIAPPMGPGSSSPAKPGM